MVMTLARFYLLAIAIVVVFLKPRIASVPICEALRSLNDTWQTPNQSLPTTNLPDPSNCDPPRAIEMGTFFFTNSSGEQLHVQAIKSPLASNYSERRNSTGILNENVSDCVEASSTAEDKIPRQKYQAANMKSYTVMHVDEGAHDRAMAHADEDAVLHEIASMHAVVEGEDGAHLVNEEGSTSPGTSIRHAVLVDTDHAARIGGNTEAPSSAAKESVQVMELGKDDVLWINPQRLGRPSPPPGSPSIHTAAQSSVARDSVQVMELNKGDLLGTDKEQLAGSTPPNDSSIHTAAQGSVARESVQAMVMEEDDVVNREQLGCLTPPPVDTSIQMAEQKSAARASMQDMEISEDSRVLVNGEQLGASIPPPVDSVIHTASQNSAARDSSFDVLFQHGDNQHDHLQIL